MKFLSFVLLPGLFARPKPRASTAVSRLGLSFTFGEAVVESAIFPGRRGRVRFRGTWWPARCDRPITLMPGARVRAIGRDGIALKVEPLAMD